jgi:hypothetical protein
MANEHIGLKDDSSVLGIEAAGEEPESGSDRPQRSARRARLGFPLPTDRLKFDVQTKILSAYVTTSGRGERAVGADRIAAATGLTSATAGLMNNFFAHMGLLERRKKGLYVPAAAAVEFHRLLTFGDPSAPTVLAAHFNRSWFFEAVSHRIAVGGPQTRDHLVDVLARLTGADRSYATQLGTLLDWLQYVGLLAADGERLRLADESTSAGDPARISNEPEVQAATPQETAGGAAGSGTLDSPNSNAPRPAFVPGRTNEPDPSPGPILGAWRPTTPSGIGAFVVNDTSAGRTTQAPAAPPPALSFHFSLNLTEAQLAEFSPEQISALFTGVGALMSIKAASKRVAE